MKQHTLYIAGSTPALDHAGALLESSFEILWKPTPRVTHLLLPVPSFEGNGTIRGGGRLEEVLSQLPREITVIGGNLHHPALADYTTMDLLDDPYYVAQNAAITAHCALRLILQRLPVTLPEQPVLVIGWGRIGKCLAMLLRQVGAAVTVAARKASDQAMAEALGFQAVSIPLADDQLPRYRVIINTAPAVVLPDAQAVLCAPNCLKIDLASRLGIGGRDVIWARGLPGTDAPESSGILIAKTVSRLLRKEQIP